MASQLYIKFIKAIKAIICIEIIPVLFQFSLYAITKSLYYPSLSEINDNTDTIALYISTIYDSIVNTILVFVLIGLVISAMGIFGNLRKAVLIYTLALLVVSFVSLLIVHMSQNIDGIGPLAVGLAFLGFHLWSLFYGISMIPSTILILLTEKNIKTSSR